MASPDKCESMEEDFTGFDDEPSLLNPGDGTEENAGQQDGAAETDSDSGNLVIAEPVKKLEAKSAEKSPRKRRARVMEDNTPTRTLPSRVKGRGLAYLLAMEKGGSKKQLAKAQAQVDAQDTSMNDSVDFAPEEIEPEPEKKVIVEKKEKVVREKTVKEVPSPVISNHSPFPVKPKITNRKSYGAANISSPLLKEPFKEGDY